jgi:hypothetical protein
MFFFMNEPDIWLYVGDIFDHLEKFAEDEMGSCLRELGKSLGEQCQRLVQLIPTWKFCDSSRGR